MDFFDAVKARRSVRKYTNKPVPAAVIQQALDAALLAPNSSNMQTWQFFWVRSPEKKAALATACLSQGAATTAQELIVVVANPSLWKRNQQEMLKRMTAEKAHERMFTYYGKLIPLLYGYRWMAPVKWLLFNTAGLFRPMSRKPWSFRDVQEVCIKSAALASENFMLAISAQGFGTCPMEGFDECRVKKVIGMNSWKNAGSRVVMVISVGEADPKGIWGPQVRFDRSWFVSEI